MRERIEQTKRLLTSLERDLRLCPDRFAMERLNRTLIVLLQNQVAIMRALAGEDAREAGDGKARVVAAVEKDLGGTKTTERDAPAREGEEKEEKEAADTADVEEEAEPIAIDALPEAPADVANEAVTLFEKDKLNRWLAQGGTPFQMRGDFAFVRGESLKTPSGALATRSLGRMGYTDRIGRIVVEGVSGVVILFKNPKGARRSWDDEDGAGQE